MNGITSIREPARDTPVLTECDVLVVGGGPAGCAAVVSAARLGADTILMERYGFLGGMSTGGLVIWIDRMTDWSGRRVIAGFADDLLDRIPREGLLGPPEEIWGSRDPKLTEYWRCRAGTFHDTVTWSPTIDPEMLKNASFDIVEECGVRLVLHAWAAAVIRSEASVQGIVFESKSGRQAVLAKTVIDATGDGDVFALAGESFETDIDKQGQHHRMNVAFLCAGVNAERYFQFQRTHRTEWDRIMLRAAQMDLESIPQPTPREGVFLFMGPRLAGYNCLDVRDLTAVEIESRRRNNRLIDFFRRCLPGFEKAWLMQTAPQVGVRHSRRLRGVQKMTVEAWTAGERYDDEIGVSPAPGPEYPNVSIPLNCLVAPGHGNLLAAGRNLSCDAKTHNFMREIPNCWVLGQGAGTAAAVAVNAGRTVDQVDRAEVRRQLINQGVFLQD